MGGSHRHLHRHRRLRYAPLLFIRHATLVPSAEVKPVDFKLYASNNTEITILGSLRLGFTVQGIPCTSLLVSDEVVEEIMSGIDWLTEHCCKWRFVERQVEIKGRMIPLRNRHSLAGVRCVRVAEDVCVPPGTQVNVPVKLTRNSLLTPRLPPWSNRKGGAQAFSPHELCFLIMLSLLLFDW